ncbi:MAG: sigma-70 family RNA polymerase sigma factor [Melioribacteraceae bacterium]|nr:sigma-70 family RNA polymerase sigma factor [Melioribacteraceae bacterium]
MKKGNKISDFDLIKKIQKGDKKSFETLVCRYDKYVLNIAYSYRNDVDDAKDIYQEVFIRVYNGLKNFQFRSEFSTWLFRITTNVCISYRSGKQKHVHESIDKQIDDTDENSVSKAEMLESTSDSESLTIAGEIGEYINKAVETLPEKQKMAFTLKYYQGYKIIEIAKMMNCKDGTIKRYLFTATNKLRHELKAIYN